MTAHLPPDEAEDAGDGRDSAADVRDDAADDRDAAADERDVASGRRDAVAAERDVAADQRDAAALLREQSAHGRSHQESSQRSAAARHEAARDRERASQDRLAGAVERGRAETDRGTASADRITASADRGASARDRADASIDALTGAYVRGAGLLQLEREVDRAQRTNQQLAVAFLDVDHLKQVNDAGGHAAGDRLLARVAQVIRERLRPYDLVVRYGGDEFVCVLTGVGQEEAEARFTMVNADLAGHGSVTAGVATAVGQEGGAALIARADAAMYARRPQRPPL